MTTVQKSIRNRVFIILGIGFIIGMVIPFLLMHGYGDNQPNVARVMTGLFGPVIAICLGGSLLGIVGIVILSLMVGSLWFFQIKSIAKNIIKSDVVSASFSATWLAVEWDILVILASHMNNFD